MERYFSTHMPGIRFVGNVLAFSLVSLVPVLVLYVALSPGFLRALIEGGPALERLARQVLTNGLPVVFVTNYVGFFLFALSNQTSTKDRDSARYLFIDPPIRVAVFLILHVIIYVISADLFGSFGGSKRTALRVVAPTLARSAHFENISGAYFYATLVSALPLYVSAIGKSVRLRPVTAWVPFGLGAVLLAILWFGMAALVLTAFASIITRWTS